MVWVPIEFHCIFLSMQWNSIGTETGYIFFLKCINDDRIFILSEWFNLFSLKCEKMQL